jgi:hypothetical protein
MTTSPITTQFGRYTPDIETDDPDFEQELDTVILRAELYTAESIRTDGTGRAVRVAHAQGYGLAKAEVEILGGMRWLADRMEQR